MSEPSLEARVTALETRIDEVTTDARAARVDAAAARHLAVANDRDVADVRDELRDFRRATASSFNAIREDLTDLRQQVNTGFSEVRDRFAAVDSSFAEVRGRLDGTAAGLDHITSLLTTLIDQQGDGVPV